MNCGKNQQRNDTGIKRFTRFGLDYSLTKLQNEFHSLIAAALIKWLWKRITQFSSKLFKNFFFSNLKGTVVLCFKSRRWERKFGFLEPIGKVAYWLSTVPAKPCTTVRWRFPCAALVASYKESIMLSVEFAIMIWKKSLHDDQVGGLGV